MAKEIVTFGYIETEKSRCYLNKSPIFLNDVDIEKVLVSKKIFFVKKRYKTFNDYLYNNHKVKPLHIMLHKTSEYVNKMEVLFHGR